MRTIETKIYNFSELSENAKQKAIETYRENTPYEWLGGDLSEYLKELLEKYQVEPIGIPQLEFSLSYSQGDGACFTGDFNLKNKHIQIRKNTYRYSHVNSVDIFINDSKIDKEENDFFEKVYLPICQELEREGYEIIDDVTSNEYIGGALFDYEFTEDGKVYNN